jgi:hypothetical protein
MRSSALAGFLASAVFVTGTAGFASTFLVGPYLGAQARQPARAELMNTAAPVDPLAVLQIAAPAVALEGESQEARRLRNIKNEGAPAAPAPTPAVPASTPPAPAIDTTNSDPGPITEAAFAATAQRTPAPASAGGPLIATETSSALVSAKLENGEPVLTLRVIPVIAAAAPAADIVDPDNVVESTVLSAPPAEQAIAAPAIALSTAPPPAPPALKPAPAAEPSPPPARQRTKPPALKPAADDDDDDDAPPVRKPVRAAKPAPSRVTTVATPAKPAEPEPPAPAPIDLRPPPSAADPLNAPYSPPSTDPLTSDMDDTAGDMPTTTPSTGGPTPLTMPQ